MKKDGTLWTWGRNDQGQLGTGDLRLRDHPVRVRTDKTNWISVSASTGYVFAGDMNLALDSDGEIWTWGTELGLRDRQFQRSWLPLSDFFFPRSLQEHSFNSVPRLLSNTGTNDLRRTSTASQSVADGK